LSAKWRRNRRSLKKLDILKAFGRTKSVSPAQRFRLKSSGAKQRRNPYRYKVQGVSAKKRLREPKHLVDVLEGPDEITVVAEFAGFSTEDLRVHAKAEKLTVNAERADRRYRKSLNLPKRVIPNTMRTTYKNGVLEIRLKKAEVRPIRRIAG